jgi:cysteinyl-tRNA synthetase, unknown class
MPAAPTVIPPIVDSRLAAIDDWAYMINHPDLAALGASAFDMVVIDYSADGTAATAFSAAEIAALKASPGGPKIVLAYLSIGEAEDYRFYWALENGAPGGDWSAAPPSWLGPENPDWPGSRKVRFWEPEWQRIVISNSGGHAILGDAPSYLDRILAAGFDGVFLDIVDAYEFWGPSRDGGNGQRPQAATEMAEFVIALATHARGANPDFIVCQQNASALPSADLENPIGATLAAGLMSAVDILSVEDVIYRGGRRANNDFRPDAYRIGIIDAYRLAGKLVTIIDYFDPRRSGYHPAEVDRYWDLALERGWTPTTGPRELDVLVEVPGHEPD